MIQDRCGADPASKPSSTTCRPNTRPRLTVVGWMMLVQDETHITNVADPWGGSYLMETLTQDLVKSATEVIDEVR